MAHRTTTKLTRAAGLILALLILIELAGRALGLPNYPVPGPDFFVAHELCYPELVDHDHEAIWRLRPNQIIRGGFLPRGVYTINSHGFRTPEFVEAKADSVTRVVCLGGSVMFGWGVGDEEAYPRQLEEKLNELDPAGGRWEVINLSVPDYSTWQARAVARRWLERLSPDIVIAEFAWGDHQPSANDTPDERYEAGSADAVARRNALNRWALVRYGTLIWRKLTNAGPRESARDVRWRVKPASYANNIEVLGELANAAGARAILATSPISLPPPGYSDAEGIFHYHHQYRRMARFAWTVSGGEFVEMANAFDMHPEFFENVRGGDFEHINASGHRYAGEFLARYILDLLEEPAGEDQSGLQGSQG